MRKFHLQTLTVKVAAGDPRCNHESMMPSLQRPPKQTCECGTSPDPGPDCVAHSSPRGEEHLLGAAQDNLALLQRDLRQALASRSL